MIHSFVLCFDDDLGCCDGRPRRKLCANFCRFGLHLARYIASVMFIGTCFDLTFFIELLFTLSGMR